MVKINLTRVNPVLQYVIYVNYHPYLGLEGQGQYFFNSEIFSGFAYFANSLLTKLA